MLLEKCALVAKLFGCKLRRSAYLHYPAIYRRSTGNINGTARLKRLLLVYPRPKETGFYAAFR